MLILASGLIAAVARPVADTLHRTGFLPVIERPVGLDKAVYNKPVVLSRSHIVVRRRVALVADQPGPPGAMGNSDMTGDAAHYRALVVALRMDVVLEVPTVEQHMAVGTEQISLPAVLIVSQIIERPWDTRLVCRPERAASREHESTVGTVRTLRDDGGGLFIIPMTVGAIHCLAPRRWPTFVHLRRRQRAWNRGSDLLTRGDCHRMC